MAKVEFKLSASCSHAEYLASGQPLAPGEKVALTTEEVGDPHNQRLIEEGALISLSGDDTGLTGDELQKKAKDLNIEGRSKMDADQLRQAIAEAERDNGGS